jgi:hypothetical protein
MIWNKFNYGILREEAGTPAASGDATRNGAPPQDDELEQLRAQLAQAEQKNTQLQSQVRQQPVVQPPPPQPTQAQPGQQMTEADMNRQFYQSPVRNVAEIARHEARQAAAEVYSTIQAQQGDLLVQQARETARKADPDVFDALEPLVLAKVEQMTSQMPQYKVNPTVWTNAFNMTKGENVDKVLEVKGRKTGQQGGDPSTTGRNDGPRAPSTRTPPAPKKVELSDDEKVFAKKMRLSEDQYRQGKEFHANQDKMWEGVVTFDSALEPRRIGREFAKEKGAA